MSCIREGTSMSLPIEKSLSDELAREVARRRTFAIISHPDAGKTTLTEKLLLYAGAVHLRRGSAGSVAPACGEVGLDGTGAGARNFDHLHRAAVRLSGCPGEPARYAGPPRTSAKTPTAPSWPWIARSWCSTAPKASSLRPENYSPSAANATSRS